MPPDAQALRNIGIDRDARALGEFECDYPVELKGEPARPVASLAPETVTDSAMRRYANEWAVSHAATKGICFPGCPGC